MAIGLIPGLIKLIRTDNLIERTTDFTMRNPFLNKYEQITYSKIKAVTDKVGAIVFSKVRLADVLPINGSGISDSDFRFALQSHVDFFVIDSEHLPLFSVEFDGPRHKNQIQIERDLIKNRLLKHFGHPYIRINSRYLDIKYRSLDLLTYFIDVWFLSEAFDAAQQAGYVPYDEPFDPASVISGGASNGRLWPYWLSVDHQIKIEKLWKEGKIAQMIPSHWIGVDEQNNYRCISWILTDRNKGVYIKTGMREQNFHAVHCSDLLSQIAIFELYEKLEDVLQGKRNPVSSRIIDNQIKKYENLYSPRSIAKCNTNMDNIE
ncbi:DUF2726 domain-containing protein [Candidatus Poribacteria bacterium]